MVSNVEIPTPTISDFNGVWFKIKGESISSVRYTSLGNISGVTVLDFEVSDVFTATLTGVTNLQLSNLPPNQQILIELDAVGDFDINWS